MPDPATKVAKPWSTSQRGYIIRNRINIDRKEVLAPLKHNSELVRTFDDSLAIYQSMDWSTEHVDINKQVRLMHIMLRMAAKDAWLSARYLRTEKKACTSLKFYHARTRRTKSQTVWHTSSANHSRTWLRKRILPQPSITPQDPVSLEFWFKQKKRFGKGDRWNLSINTTTKYPD